MFPSKVTDHHKSSDILVSCFSGCSCAWLGVLPSVHEVHVCRTVLRNTNNSCCSESHIWVKCVSHTFQLGQFCKEHHWRSNWPLLCLLVCCQQKLIDFLGGPCCLCPPPESLIAPGEAEQRTLIIKFYHFVTYFKTIQPVLWKAKGWRTTCILESMQDQELDLWNGVADQPPDQRWERPNSWWWISMYINSLDVSQQTPNKAAKGEVLEHHLCLVPTVQFLQSYEYRYLSIDIWV